MSDPKSSLWIYDGVTISRFELISHNSYPQKYGSGILYK